MERRLCLLLVIILIASPALALDPSAKLAQCNEEHADCRENCTIDYGTSFKLRGKLTKCVKKCSKKVSTCRAISAEYEQAGLTVPDEPKPKVNKKEELAPVLEVEQDHSTSSVTASEQREEAPTVERKDEGAAAVEKVEEPQREKAKPSEKKVEAAKEVEKPVKKAADKKAEEEAPAPKKQQDLDQWDEGVIDR